MGIGIATGENRAVEAARTAVSSPLLDLSINGARGVLFNISGGPDLSMWEINEAAKVITESVNPDAKIIFGAVHDDRLKKGMIKITVIATGFNAGGQTGDSLFKKMAGSTMGSERSESAPAEDWEVVPAFLRRKPVK
jgi:cell division protein FtsZ